MNTMYPRHYCNCESFGGINAIVRKMDWYEVSSIHGEMATADCLEWQLRA
jgi:hypothetical protein